MDYQTYKPHPDLEALIKCYWTLDVPAALDSTRQRIVPDGCIEMAFILADDIKRYTSDTDFILQPRAMVLGQITDPFYIEPVGNVKTFAIRFYPYGFSNFIKFPLNELLNKETPLAEIFGTAASTTLYQEVISTPSTLARIETCERFLFRLLKNRSTVDNIIKSTVDALIQTRGKHSIKEILKNNLSKRRQLERKFASQVGISPKQLGKIIRLQAAMKLLLSEEVENYSHVAYETEYYDQAHFIRDFKEFTGTTPSELIMDSSMALSSMITRKG